MNLLEAAASSAINGRYVVRTRLAVGGMAEIFLARQITPGFEKDVVIKRLRPELVDDPRMRAMFRDESTVGAYLNHPNTVHVYDVGDDSGAPFIAMEYIRGEELNALCRRGLAAGQFLPLEHAVEIVRQAALSLGHFHAARDGNGQPLSVVHCDISPTNLLVTEDGFLKVIDFGIVRFRGQEYVDDAAVPGKLSYMSPEQARRERLDHRSDIFALGIVLYEITLGRRLFKGPADQIAERLRTCDVRAPTFLSNDYPGALESIVMRALEGRPSDRYSTAFDLADDLAAFLLEIGSPSGPVALARYLDRLTVAGGGQRRPELVSENEVDDGEDELDFDRGVSRALGASAQTAAAALEWDEVEEDEQAVADALGIDVNLVRTQTRLSESDSDDAQATLSFDRLAASVSNDRMPTNPRDAAPVAAATQLSRPRPRPDPAASIKPLPQPRNLVMTAVAFALGGALVFLILQLLG